MEEDNSAFPPPENQTNDPLRTARKWSLEDETTLLQLREANPFQDGESFVQEALRLFPSRTANAIRTKIQRLKNSPDSPKPYDFDLSSLVESELSDSANGVDKERNQNPPHDLSAPPNEPTNENFKRPKETAGESPAPRRSARAGANKRRKTDFPLQKGPQRPSPLNHGLSYDELLERLKLADWARILNDAQDCKVYKAQAEKDRRDTLSSIDELRKKDLELRRLKDIHEISNQSDQPFSAINAGVQAAWSKMLDILPKNVPSFYWENPVMKETITEMKEELEKLNKATGDCGVSNNIPKADSETDPKI